MSEIVFVAKMKSGEHRKYVRGSFTEDLADYVSVWIAEMIRKGDALISWHAIDESSGVVVRQSSDSIAWEIREGKIRRKKDG